MRSRTFPPAFQYTVVCLLIIFAVVVEGRYGYKIERNNVRPDLCVVVLAAVSGLFGSRKGALFGLLGGLLSAALFPFNFGTQVVSRTVGGLVTGNVPAVIDSDSPLMGPLCGIVCTGTVEIASVLMAPTHHLHAWALHVAAEVVYNSLLTLPVYSILHACRIGRMRELSLFSR